MTAPVDGRFPSVVDEHAARAVAGIVVLIAGASLWPPAMGLVALLAADFVLRGFVSPRFSPLAWAARSAVSAAHWAPKPVYAPPKRFAAQIGTVLTAVALLAHLAGAHAVSVATVALLVAAASLEAFAGFCIACWVYPVVFRARGW